MTYCQCGMCESSRRGMQETGRRYRVPEPPRWLPEICDATVELITKDSLTSPTARCILPKGHGGMHFVGLVPEKQ